MTKRGQERTPGWWRQTVGGQSHEMTDQERVGSAKCRQRSQGLQPESAGVLGLVASDS